MESTKISKYRCSLKEPFLYQEVFKLGISDYVHCGNKQDEFYILSVKN